MKFKLISGFLILLAGCATAQRENPEASFDKLYLKTDIAGIFSTRSGFSGCNLAIQPVKENEYIVTSQEWSDMVRYPRFSEKAHLVNGLLYFKVPLTVATSTGREQVRILRVFQYMGKPLISSNEYADKNLKAEPDLFYRKEDFPDGPSF